MASVRDTIHEALNFAIRQSPTGTTMRLYLTRGAFKALSSATAPRNARPGQSLGHCRGFEILLTDRDDRIEVYSSTPVIIPLLLNLSEDKPGPQAGDRITFYVHGDEESGYEKANELGAVEGEPLYDAIVGACYELRLDFEVNESGDGLTLVEVDGRKLEGA
jgi:hypothetical protein